MRSNSIPDLSDFFATSATGNRLTTSPLRTGLPIRTSRSVMSLVVHRARFHSTVLLSPCCFCKKVWFFRPHRRTPPHSFNLWMNMLPRIREARCLLPPCCFRKSRSHLRFATGTVDQVHILAAVSSSKRFYAPLLQHYDMPFSRNWNPMFCRGSLQALASCIACGGFKVNRGPRGRRRH